MSGEQMERKYLYALIFVAFIGGFAAGAITMKVAHVQPISRFTPIGNSGFEAFDTVTGRECISASEEEVFVRLKNERIAKYGTSQCDERGRCRVDSRPDARARGLVEWPLGLSWDALLLGTGKVNERSSPTR